MPATGIVDDALLTKLKEVTARLASRDVDAARVRNADAARERDNQARQNPGTEFKDCAECPAMITVPAGSVTMGVLYDYSLIALVIFGVVAQLAAAVLFVWLRRPLEAIKKEV